MTRYSLLVLVALIITSCGNEKKKEAPEVMTVETTKKFEHKAAEIEVSFNDDKNKAVFAAYIELKTAFVNTDAAWAAKAASELMTAFANIGVEESALSAVQVIAESQDVEAQRKAFVDVTAAVEKILEESIDSGVIYKQYCPMAFKNTGAYWLSESSEIANPYFGDKMYRCGRVSEIFE